MKFAEWALHFLKYKSCHNDYVAVAYNESTDKYSLYRCYAKEWYYSATYEIGTNAFATFLQLALRPCSYHEFYRFHRKPVKVDLRSQFTEKDKLILSMMNDDPMALDLLEDILVNGG